jgi:hypothetical protein
VRIAPALPAFLLAAWIWCPAQLAQADGDSPIYRVVKLPSHLPAQGANGGQLNDAGTWVGAATVDATDDKESVVVQEVGRQPVFLAQLVEHPGIRSGRFHITSGGLVPWGRARIDAPGRLPTLLSPRIPGVAP